MTSMIGTSKHPPQRFLLAMTVFLFAAACSSSGGGGPADAPPTIVTAAFVGAAATPAAGDTLLLTFSEPVTLGAGLLTDADVALSAGASLGDVTAAPIVQSSNTISIQLGAGVTLTPGATTIALAPGNDVVRDASGQLGTGGTPVVIGTSDGANPAIGNVTVANVDDPLNGTGPAGGTLQTPANGFTIDLAYSDNTAIATAQTRITANVVVTGPGGALPIGTDLRPFLTTASANNTSASYLVPATVVFPNGPVTISCIVVDTSGLASTPASYAFQVRAFTDALRPFERNVNPQQVWFLDFARDVETYTTSAIVGGVTVNVVDAANGVADYADMLFVLGLLAPSPQPNVQGSLDSNQVVDARFKNALLAELAVLYDGAPVSFTLTRPPGNFGTSASVPYNSFGYSQISIAGAADAFGVLGVAIFDPSNDSQDDDTRLDFFGTRLGVFLHTIVDTGLRPPGTSLFRLTFDQFVPSLGGTPIGSVAADAQRLSGTLNDARTTAIQLAIADFARFTAVVTAHECGHSMGLVQDGPMPLGLYGDDAVNFPGSVEGHIRNTALFPPGATNVMSPTLSYQSAVNPASTFNSLNFAYLREQVFYGN